MSARMTSDTFTTKSMKKIPARQRLAVNLARLMETTPGLNTFQAVAKRAGVAHSHIGRILHQQSSATVDMLDALAGAFGLEPWELLTDFETTREEALRRMLAIDPPKGNVVEIRRRKDKPTGQ
jgi:transcriptional regulator with XRE-family HTH domain